MEAFNSKRSVSRPLMPSRSRYPPSENLINIGYIDPIHFSRTNASPTSDIDVAYRSPTPPAFVFDFDFDFSRNYGAQVFRSPRSGKLPLTSIENIQTPPSSRSPRPLKVEEDVIVMDGILVKSPGGRGSRSPLDSGNGGRGSRSPLDSKSMSNSVDETSSSRNGAKGQFAQGKEELRTTQYSNKNKPERHASKTLTTEVSATNGTKYGFPCQVGAVNETETVQKVDQQNDITTWSPMDDGIVACEQSSSTNGYLTRDAVNAQINEALYGPRKKHRLPIFREICPE